MGRADQLQDFRRFDFAADGRFTEYLKRVELPSDDPALLERVQARWYKKTVDVNFDLAWLTAPAPGGGTPATRAAQFSRFTPTPTPSAAGKPTGTASTGNAPSASTQASYRPPGASTNTRLPGTAVQQRWLILYHTVFLVLALVHLIPLMPRVSVRAFRHAHQIAILGQGYRLFARFGLPRLRPFSWPILQQWLTQVLPTSDFHWAVMAVAFSAQPPITLTLLGPGLLALQSVLSYGAEHKAETLMWRKVGSPLHALMQSKQREAALASAFSEVAVGGLLILQLAGSSRNIMLTIMTWNLLKSRHNVSDAAQQHRAVWSTIDQRIHPLAARLPVVQTGLGYVKRWFTSVPGQS